MARQLTVRNPRTGDVVFPWAAEGMWRFIDRHHVDCELGGWF